MLQIVIFLQLLLFRLVNTDENIANETLPEFLDSQSILLRDLFRDYANDVPALYTRDRYTNLSIITPINITLTYFKLLSLESSFILNEPEQSSLVIVEYFERWTDTRLRWNPADYNGIELLMVNRKLVWIPDIMAYDIISFAETRYPEQQHVILYPNGTAVFYVTYVLNILCHLDISDFPFDEQLCPIKLTSENFISKELTLHGDIYSDIEWDIMSNGEWSVLNMTIEHLTYPMDVYGDWQQPIVKYWFKIRRSPVYYIILMIIPSFILTSLCVVGVFWSEIRQETYMEKLSLAFAAILAMVVILQITTDNMPKTSHIPILSIFILNNLILVTVAIAVILLTGKYLSRRSTIKKLEIEKKSPDISTFRRCFIFFVVKIHRFYFFLFMTATLVNLIVLLSRRSVADNRIIICDDTG